MSEKRRGLGRGLGALIPSTNTIPAGGRPVDVFFPGRDKITAVPARTVPTPPAVTSPEPAEPSDDAPEGRAVPERAPDVSRETPGRDEVPTDHAPAENADTAVSDIERPEVSRETADALVAVPGARFAEIPVGNIVPNPRQPRTVFDEDELAELVNSVREIGVLQPVVVRAVEGTDDRYELIMGERRWRASQDAGLATVPAIVRDTADDDLLRDALLENLHRSQLNPLEEAAAYNQLLEDFGCTHDELAGRIGRSRPQISNTLRLLRLPPLVQRRVAAGVLSAGHARALLGLAEGAAMERLAQRIVAEGLSVRAVEEIVSMGLDDAPVTRPKRPRAGGRRVELDDLAQRLSDRFDTRVQIALGQRKGRLSVEFASVDDLNRIVALLAPGDAAFVGGDAQPKA